MRREHTVLREAAEAVTAHLAELLCAGQPRVFADRLRRAPDDEHLIALARSEPAVGAWLADYLDAAGSRSRNYTRLPGDAGRVAPSARFRCPLGTLVWYRRFVGERPPRCPVHDVDLVRLDDGPVGT
jgi:hypothetical protein